MAQSEGQRIGDLQVQDGFWRLRWTDVATGLNGLMDRRPGEQAERIGAAFLARMGRYAPAPPAAITIAEFVEKVFVPEHVAMKQLSGRTHFHAILKHVLTPEEVERVFEAGAANWKTKLKTVPNWPYLGAVRLCDARHDDVQRIVSAALARGYSTQTAAHIRNVIKAIFEHARKRHLFTGDNPAGQVRLPGMTRKVARALTVTQLKEVLVRMQYPEKEMALIAVLTGMNVAEICGMQWKYVNLTGNWTGAEGELIPPRTIAVRQQWYRGRLGDVNKQSRSRNTPIPDSLLPLLLGLSRRAHFTGPDDFVLVSRVGTPVDAKAMAARRLKSAGEDLQIPCLSWQVFYRTRKSLLYEHGVRFQADPTFLAGEGPEVAVRDPLPASVCAAPASTFP
jgi:integrase